MRGLTLALGLLLATVARAAPATLGPDGTPYAKEPTPNDYPAELANRPLTLPSGMGSLHLTFQGQTTSASGGTFQFSTAVSAAYGLTQNLQVGANVDSNGSGVGGSAIYQFFRNGAARVAFDYTSQTDPSTGDVSRRISLTGGLPLKFKLAPGIPLAIGGLDSLITTFFPIATSSTDITTGIYVRITTPVYLQYNPLPFIGLDLTMTPTFPVGSGAGLTTIAGSLATYYTRPHFDAGLVGSITGRSSYEGVTESTVYAVELVMRGRL